jgi:hypothetical protein
MIKLLTSSSPEARNSSALRLPTNLPARDIKSASWMISSQATLRRRCDRPIPKLSLRIKRASRMRGSSSSKVRLVAHCDIGRLRTLGAFFDSELDLLSFLQIAVSTITLNSREMDENVRSAFACDKTVTLVTVEPLDCTDCSFRHCICLLWQFEKLGVLFGSIGGQTKTTHVSNRELLVFVLPIRTYCYPTTRRITH